MWRNYWTVAVRGLAKNKTYSIITIAGLAIGMAACILIILYVRSERSYDRWLPDVASTYELQTWSPRPKDGRPFFTQMAGYPSKEAVTKDFPQVVAATYAMNVDPVLIQDGQAFATDAYLLTDNDFLKAVDLPLMAGTNAREPGTGLITRSEAIKRYQTDKVLGKTLTILTKGETLDYRIVGVLKDLPRNSSLKIGALLRTDFNSLFGKDSNLLTCWNCQPGWLFVKFRPGTNIEQVEARMPAWEKRNIPDREIAGERVNAGDEEDWHFINLSDVHLGRAQEGAMIPGNDLRSIETFGTIALLVLAMAVVNFVNLATARSGQRAREVALRKVLGARRAQLVVQFLAESMAFAAAATLLALALVELLVKPLSAFLDADLSLDYLGPAGMLLPVTAITLLVGLSGGLYPAFVLSRFQPAQVLKANRSASETPGLGRVRFILVVAQFAISIALMICTTIIYGQTRYARSADPGYKRDHILEVTNMDRMQLLARGEDLVEQMKQIPGVIAVGRTDIGVGSTKHHDTNVIAADGQRVVRLGSYNVDASLLEAMGLRLLAGRWFDPNRPIDDMTFGFPPDKERETVLARRGVNVVLNELAAKELGFRSPADAIGKVIHGELFGRGVPTADASVIGIVGNSRFRSIRTPIEPIMFQNSKMGEPDMIIRYRGEPAVVEAAVANKWKRLINDVPFEARLSDDVTRDLYKKEDARAKIFAAFSVLAVLIGCLGVFGLAAFTAERRTKEIGIRRVFGAHAADIVRLLVWQFTRPVIIANLIAWPVAWWMMRSWLNGFDDRIVLTPLPFVAAGAIAWSLATATIAAHALKVAHTNPIAALRYE